MHDRSPVRVVGLAAHVAIEGAAWENINERPFSRPSVRCELERAKTSFPPHDPNSFTDTSFHVSSMFISIFIHSIRCIT